MVEKERLLEKKVIEKKIRKRMIDLELKLVDLAKAIDCQSYQVQQVINGERATEYIREGIENLLMEEYWDKAS